MNAVVRTDPVQLVQLGTRTFSLLQTDVCLNTATQSVTVKDHAMLLINIYGCYQVCSITITGRWTLDVNNLINSA